MKTICYYRMNLDLTNIILIQDCTQVSTLRFFVTFTQIKIPIQGGCMEKLILVAALMSLNVYAQVPTIVEAPVDHAFVPVGFDNNDNIEVVITGKFPNPCYTRNKVEVKVKDDQIDVTISSLHKPNPAMTLCEPLKVPFTEVVTIGNLQAGDYIINVNNKLKEGLEVATSNSQSVDDHLYASVEYVELGFTGGLSGDALLVGKNISSCLELDHVEYVSNGKDTYSVLPIMKKVSDYCPEGNKRIEIPLKFDVNGLKNDKILLFVRSIDGKSIHSIIDKE